MGQTIDSREKLITLQEAAELLACTRRNVVEMMNAGELHPIDISARGKASKRKTWRLSMREVNAFIRSRTHRAQPVEEPTDEHATKAA